MNVASEVDRGWAAAAPSPGEPRSTEVPPKAMIFMILSRSRAEASRRSRLHAQPAMQPHGALLPPATTLVYIFFRPDAICFSSSGRESQPGGVHHGGYRLVVPSELIQGNGEVVERLRVMRIDACCALV